MVKRTAVASLLALLLAATVQAKANTPESVLVKAVTDQLRTYTSFTVFDDVLVGVDAGVVTLTGKVTMRYKANDIERRMARVAGVHEVRNEIQVLPLSRFDDSLRSSIAQAIYSHPALRQYAATTHPPIHILVENGRVTLTGVVNNNVERALAYSLASSSVALSVQNDLKTDMEMKASKGERP
jgi:hyperosmotically inducible periplasmic protein